MLPCGQDLSSPALQLPSQLRSLHQKGREMPCSRADTLPADGRSQPRALPEVLCPLLCAWTVTVTNLQGLCSHSHGPENRAYRTAWASAASTTAFLPAETGHRCHGQTSRPCVRAASSTHGTAVLVPIGSPLHSQPERSRATVSAGCTGKVAPGLCSLLSHRSAYTSLSAMFRTEVLLFTSTNPQKKKRAISTVGRTPGRGRRRCRAGWSQASTLGLALPTLLGGWLGRAWRLQC